MKIQHLFIIILCGICTYAYAASNTGNVPTAYYPGVPADGDYRIYLNPGESLNVVVTNSEVSYSLQSVEAQGGMAVYLAATYRVLINTPEAMPDPININLNQILNQATP